MLWLLVTFLISLFFIYLNKSVDTEESENTEESEDNGEGEDEEEFVCIICMDAHPETMVLPCRHVTVCVECSLQLVNTADRYTCCQCRREITGIVDLVHDNLRKPGRIVSE